MKPSTNSLFGISEELIEAYESARLENSETRLAEYLPPAGHPQRLSTLQELIRIDMELRQRNGHPVTLEYYRTEWPDLFADPVLVSPLVFEEYRLSRLRGDTADAEEFGNRYGVDVAGWPVLIPSEMSQVSRSEQGGPSLTGGRDLCLEPGDRVLDFQIIAQLGAGAFSRVYLARQETLSGRLVVLKFSSRQLKEADKLARLQHTNIVPLYSVHIWQELSLLCMPWFGSATLRDVIQSAHSLASCPTGEMLLSTVQGCDSGIQTKINGTTEIDQYSQSSRQTPRSSDTSLLDRRASILSGLTGELAVVWIVRQIAEGLRHAHGRGILHRDLKPANVLLTSDGQPMILDFNLSSDQPNESLVGGTLAYMSPEQLDSLESLKSLSPQADLFSVGVIFHELLTGARPYSDATSSRRQLMEERWSKPISPRAVANSISIDTDSIVRKCLAPDPAQRYASADELIEDLDCQLTSRSLIHAPNRSFGERIRKWIRRHPRLTSMTSVAVLSLGLLLIGGLAYLRVQSRWVEARAVSAASQFLQQVPELQATAFAAAIGEYDRSAAAAKLDESLRLLDSGLSAAESRHVSVASAKDSAAELRSLVTLLQGREIDNLEASDDHQAYLSAVQCVLRHEFSAAADLLRPIVARHPDWFQSTLLLGMLARSQQIDDSAGALLSASIALKPDNYSARLQRALYSLQNGLFPAAVADIQEALKLRPESAEAWFVRALICQADGQNDEALRSFDHAIKYKFPETRIYFAKADLLDTMGRTDAAKEVREFGLKQTPADDRSWVARGLARLPGDPELAVQEIREAFRLNPSSHDGFRNLSMVQSEYLKQYDAAVETLNDAVRFHPEDEFLWAGRGVLHARLGAKEKAIADAEMAQALSQDAFLLYMVSCIHALCADSDQSESHQRAVQLIADSLMKDPGLAGSMRSDPDLDHVKTDPRFESLLRSAELLQTVRASGRQGAK